MEWNGMEWNGMVKLAAKHLLRHDVPSSLAERAGPPVDVSDTVHVLQCKTCQET